MPLSISSLGQSSTKFWDNSDTDIIEYGEGGTLKDFIGNVGEVRLLGWMLQVVKRLQEMHCQGIIHGDLKPDNIIIAKSGKAKIIDLAQSGFTKPYHAPEFPELFEIDIYSYGIIYWVLLFGDVASLPELSNENLSPLHT